MAHVALFCEPDDFQELWSGETVHNLHKANEIIRFCSDAETLTEEDDEAIVQDLYALGVYDIKEKPRGCTDLKDAAERYKFELGRYLTGRVERYEELVVLKQYVRTMIRSVTQRDVLVSWSTVDSLGYYSDDETAPTTHGCADIMYVPSRQEYVPPLPDEHFAGAVLRLCDPYTDLARILPSLRPLAVLVFEGLRGLDTDTSSERRDRWKWESQVHPYVKAGVLKVLSNEYPLPRKRVPQYPRPLQHYRDVEEYPDPADYHVFLYDPDGRVDDATVERLASTHMTTRESLGRSCTDYALGGGQHRLESYHLG